MRALEPAPEGGRSRRRHGTRGEGGREGIEAAAADRSRASKSSVLISPPPAERRATEAIVSGKKVERLENRRRRRALSLLLLDPRRYIFPHALPDPCVSKRPGMFVRPIWGFTGRG